MSFARHARTVSLLTLVSRFTGLARDATLSRVFGAGGLTDAFFFAFLIPNLFRRLFGEGALAAAFLPVYTEADRDDPERARQLASLLAGRLVIGLGLVTILGELALYAVSHTLDHDHLAVWLTMIMLPYMPLVCLVALLGAMLQVHGRFGPAAAAPIVLNGAIVAAALLAPPMLGFALASSPHIAVVAASVVVAGVVQVAWSLAALRGVGWWRRQVDDGHALLRTVLRRTLPMLLGLGVFQINTLLDGVIASYPEVIGPTIAGYDYPLERGAMAAVSFAQRLYQFPLGVFGIAVATALFPALARLATDAEAFRTTLRRGLRLVVFIGLPASVGLILVRRPLTSVILEGGAFDASDTLRTSRILLGYAPAVWAYSMTHVLTRAFYAKGDAMTPVRVAAGVVTLNVLLNVTLIWTPLREAGLAWSTAICAVLQTILLTRRLGATTGPLVDRAVVRSWLGALAGSLAMAAMVVATLIAVGPVTSWAGTLALLGLLVVLGAATYAFVAWRLRMPELRWSLGAEN